MLDLSRDQLKHYQALLAAVDIGGTLGPTFRSDHFAWLEHRIRSEPGDTNGYLVALLLQLRLNTELIGKFMALAAKLKLDGWDVRKFPEGFAVFGMAAQYCYIAYESNTHAALEILFQQKEGLVKNEATTLCGDGEDLLRQDPTGQSLCQWIVDFASTRDWGPGYTAGLHTAGVHWTFWMDTLTQRGYRRG